MITQRTRKIAVAGIVLLCATALGIRVYQQTETIGPQPPNVAQVERQMKREMRRGWLRVLLHDRVLEVRVNGEAVLGYTGRPPVLDSVNPGVVRGIAMKALDLYSPPQYGAPPGVDTIRIRLRHAYMFGPITYRVRGRNFTFATADLRP